MSVEDIYKEIAKLNFYDAKVFANRNGVLIATVWDFCTILGIVQCSNTYHVSITDLIKSKHSVDMPSIPINTTTIESSSKNKSSCCGGGVVK